MYMEQTINEQHIPLKINSLKQYIQYAKEERYEENPCIAEAMYKYSQHIISDALEGKSVKDMDSNQFGVTILTYWQKQGMSHEDCTWLLSVGIDERFRKRLRINFDEVYVELSWDGIL